MKKSANKIGGIYSLRHAYAIHQLENGLPVHQLQCLLEHQQLQSTLRYVHDDAFGWLRVCPKVSVARAAHRKEFIAALSVSSGNCK